jgi:hypothetical protein
VSPLPPPVSSPRHAWPARPFASALTSIAASALLALAPAAAAAPPVKLHAGLTPERLGKGTTVHVGFQIRPRRGEPVSPVTSIDIRYPHGLGLASSELGVESCTPARLELGGPSACPADSLMGRGSALVQVPFENETLSEQGRVTVVSAPVQNGHLALLYFVSGDLPVLSRLVLPGLVLPATVPFGGLLETTVPPLLSVPEGPGVALMQMQTTIGPNGLIYNERTGSHTRFFRPEGILLPLTCPRGGFPFSIHLNFEDGATSTARTAVPCPRSARR